MKISEREVIYGAPMTDPQQTAVGVGGSGALQVHAGIWFINDTLRSIGPA